MMLKTWRTPEEAIKAADEAGETVVYQIGDRYTIKCTSGLCNAVAAKEGDIWIRKG